MSFRKEIQNLKSELNDLRFQLGILNKDFNERIDRIINHFELRMKDSEIEKLKKEIEGMSTKK